MPGLTIGYLNESEATELIRRNVPSGQKRREAWEALDLDDRETLLRAALISVESLKYIKAKRDNWQALEFPRTGMSVVPAVIPLAQALEACAMAACGGEPAQRAALRAQGVGGFSAGDLREEYRSGEGRGKLLSREAAALLGRYAAEVSAFA